MNRKQSTPKAPKNATPASSSSSLPLLHPRAAGIDLGAETHYVAVPPEADPKPIRPFGVCTADYRDLVAWLKTCQITTVAMEATGVYWMVLYSTLETAGFEVLLVDARQTRNVSGRKTDVQDAEWIRRLHSFGLLAPAFVPPEAIRQVRTLWRHRGMLVEDKAAKILQIHKALDLMGLHIHKVLADITGVTGMAMLRALLAGERNPRKFLELIRPGVKGTEAEFLKALEGRYTPDLVFQLQQLVDQMDFTVAQIQACDTRMEALLAALPPAPPRPEPEPPSGPAAPPPAPAAAGKAKKPRKGAKPGGPKPPSRRKNELHFDGPKAAQRVLGIDLQVLEGISDLTTLTVLTEIGPDLSRFRTAKHFTSWLGLCPNHRVTGGKIKTRGTKKVANRVALALRLAAQSLHQGHSYLGGFYRALKARCGPAKAVTATARKLAERIYLLMTKGPAYVQRGAEAYEAQFRERQLRALTARAARLGFELTPKAPAPAPAA